MPQEQRATALEPHHTIWDRFDGPFSAGTPGARWEYFGDGTFVANDGIPTPSPAGLRVVPPGKNPTTGEPAYTLTAAQEKDANGTPGHFDRCKWLVYTSHKASTGVLGFDAVRGQELAFETWITGRTYGTRGHPFGSAVKNPEDDVRLAMIGQNVIDHETGMVLDFMFSNQQVYVLYERLPYARTPQNHYAAFTYLIPVAQRTPEAVHHVKITYDRAAGVVKWFLDGKEVFRVDRVGRRIDDRWLACNEGGTEEELELRQLNCGMGLFTLLDAFKDGRGLVRLSGDPNYYVLPPAQGGAPSGFVDEKSQPGSRIFGQGAEIHVREYIISSTRLG